MMKQKGSRAACLVAIFAICASGATAAPLEGLQEPVQLVFDQFRVPTVVAQNEHDAIFMQGYMHARDRFFQMDFQRKAFSGRVAELVGPSGLPSDVQLRTLGLRRAAEDSLLVQTPEVIAWLEAYADGVNAWLSDPATVLPIEYNPLEIDINGIEPWTPADSLTMVKGLAFQLSFDLEDIDRTYAVLAFRQVGELLGFNGLQLFNTDLYRSAPFDPSISIPSTPLPAPAAALTGGVDNCDGWTGRSNYVELRCTPVTGATAAGSPDEDQGPAYMRDPLFFELVKDYREAAAKVPLLKQALEMDFTAKGSNWWIADGSLTDSGYPMIANDPHLSLGSPSTFYEFHIYVEGGINVTGASFPGAPGVVIGCNDTICWGATVNPLDVTDVYQEVLLALGPDPTVPTHTFFDGAPEPLQFIEQQYFFNAIGNGFPNTVFNAGLGPDQGGVTLIVPRRNSGPIVGTAFDPDSGRVIGLSVAYTGWSPTRELECFRQFAHAASMDDFKQALQYFDVGSQNWSYADINGNIAYYTSAELPIREDLQFGLFPDGLQPPYWIRDGTHTLKHEWVPKINPQPGQALNNEILPFAEMPQVENPPAGYVLNANNDPIGVTLDNVPWNEFRAGFNGRLYLSPGYATGWRQGQLVKQFTAAASAGPLGVAQFAALQGNNQMLDAEVLTPYILAAFDNAQDPGAHPALAALAAEPRIAEAVARLADWNFSTPTGIIEGFDPGDNPLAPTPPTQEEIDASVAATIYSLWRGQILARTIDLTLESLPIPLIDYVSGGAQSMAFLRRLLDNYETTGGTGASLLKFFVVPGVADTFMARDIILLQTLLAALDLAASDEFAPAFGNSTNLEDYRWGRLHRIVFRHPLGGPFDVPPSGILGPELPGIPRAGGMGVLDASSHNARSDGLNEFMFGSGPSRRLIATMAPDGPQMLEVIPGGESGQPGNPYNTDQLGLWLVNAYKPLPVSLDEVLAMAVDTEDYAPPFCGDFVVNQVSEQCDLGDQNGAGLGCDEFCQEVPLLVELESFTAEITPRGILLKWTTRIELDTAGFRLLRGSGRGEKGLTLLTPTPIAPQGSDLVGASYEYLDGSAPKGSVYFYLEDIDNFGRTRRHGPVTVERGRSTRSSK